MICMIGTMLYLMLYVIPNTFDNFKLLEDFGDVEACLGEEKK